MTPIARPTTYRGTRMRSRLEASFAASLDAFGAPWEYEPNCFGAAAGQYLPDFRIRVPLISRAGGEELLEVPAYVEVKPQGNVWTHPVFVWQEIVRESEPDAVVLLWIGSDPGRFTGLQQLQPVEWSLTRCCSCLTRALAADNPACPRCQMGHFECPGSPAFEIAAHRVATDDPYDGPALGALRRDNRR